MNRAIVQQLSIRPLKQEELVDAVAICAQAMRDNPLHTKVFGQTCNDPVKTCSGLNLILWRKFDHEYRDEVRESSLDSQA